MIDENPSLKIWLMIS